MSEVTPVGDAAQNHAIMVTMDDGVATMALNRPAVRNAIDDAMRSEMTLALEEIAANPDVRVLVLTGNGRSFCSGGDIKGMQQRLSAPRGDVAINGWRRQQRTHHAMAALHNLPKPTIAAVNGAAMGLGCDLALCCDFVVASQTATFGMTYAKRGLVPDGGGMYFLPRRVGLAKAKELIFSARIVDADEAFAIGMIERVAAPETMLDDAQAWARELAQMPPGALALSKSILNQSFELTMDQVFAMGSQAQAACYTSTDHVEQVSAFLNKKSEAR